MTPPRKSGEFERIARIFAPLAAGWPSAFDLTDDAALLRSRPGTELVVTTDTAVGGVHFVGDEPPSLIARKLLRVNLSDLAAMGARPLVYTMNMALPATLPDDWLEDFAAGLAADQAAFDVTLIGGDSVATPGALTLTITAFGEVAEGLALRRSGARPGDDIWVSGTIGDGVLGLKAVRGELGGLEQDHIVALTARYRLPQPRLTLGQRLPGLASAALDISDGLVADLGHIAETSGVAASIEAGKVPMSPAAQAAIASAPDLLAVAITGGDDYELLFTASPAEASRIAALERELGLPLTRIGRIEAGSGTRVFDRNGREMALARTGYRHG